MVEKKEHHLTRAKRLREEAEARGEIIEETIASQEEEVEVVKVVKTKTVGRPYRVFDKRSALVAQVNTLEEAEEEVARFPGGTYRMV